ncbi:hypothetical protein [Candidatus Viadribacter manganicus]|uniref:Uncharacterized protein n=1 Tax=Candidatus Viadribacter manganicus TaxID=1759059 RepID=A0A1B1AGN3_9PROT|nr:hypothetical protein [Candidatus Viadribacter manganicus]ANP45714.1 hypothetical protein ATE48_07175 [Candidatus Viadribacter manganicus]
MKVELLILGFGVSAGFAAGWLLTPPPSAPVAAPIIAPALVHAGVEAGDMRERLERLAPAPAELAPEAPPAPDIALLFRRDLTAIEAQGEAAIVYVVDGAWSRQRRALRVGDIYRDGWRVSAISAQRVQLRRRREIRSVEAFALPVIEP